MKKLVGFEVFTVALTVGVYLISFHIFKTSFVIILAIVPHPVWHRGVLKFRARSPFFSLRMPEFYLR